jgi:hypothetical protein
MPQPNDLSRSLVALDQDSTIIAVVELDQTGRQRISLSSLTAGLDLSGRSETLVVTAVN